MELGTNEESAPLYLEGLRLEGCEGVRAAWTVPYPWLEEMIPPHLEAQTYPPGFGPITVEIMHCVRAQAGSVTENERHLMRVSVPVMERATRTAGMWLHSMATDSQVVATGGDPWFSDLAEAVFSRHDGAVATQWRVLMGTDSLDVSHTQALGDRFSIQESMTVWIGVEGSKAGVVQSQSTYRKLDVVELDAFSGRPVEEHGIDAKPIHVGVGGRMIVDRSETWLHLDLNPWE